MKKDIIIVGAGGFGREVFNYIEDVINAGADWSFKGFLDDNLDALANYDYPKKVIGKIKNYIPCENDYFICAIGGPKLKKDLVSSLVERGGKFESLIHPTARIGRNVHIGRGVVLCPYTSLNCDSFVGNYVMINGMSGCGHDSYVGDYATISAHCDITGFCKVGEGAFLASRVSMRPGSKVGNWASVGIGSCVIMNIKDGVSAFGNPAVALK